MDITELNTGLLPLELQQSQFKVAPERGEGKEDTDLWDAAVQFESLFMSYLLKSMQSSLPEENPMKEGLPGMMFTQVMGDAMSEGGGIGLAEIIYRDLQSKGSQDQSENEGVASLQNLIMPQVSEEQNDE